MPRRRGIPRQEFARTAVAIGGVSALAACLDRTGDGGDSPEATAAAPRFPQGPSDPATHPARQHAWASFLATDVGTPVPPQHQVVLFLAYTGSVPPTEAEREQVRGALESVERAFQRGTGGAGESVNRGLLFTLGYSPSYFDRFDGSLPGSVDLPRPEELCRAVGEDPANARRHDAALHLGSDSAQVVLAVEAALFGELSAVNGVEMDADLGGVFERAGRHAGFAGRETQDDEAPPRTSSVGLPGFDDTRDGEDAVTIEAGPFAGGTTQQVSRLAVDTPGADGAGPAGDSAPAVLPRGEFVGDDDPGDVLTVGTLQREIAAFVDAWNAVERRPDAGGPTATERAVFLVPPRGERALPRPQGL